VNATAGEISEPQGGGESVGGRVVERAGIAQGIFDQVAEQGDRQIIQQQAADGFVDASVVTQCPNQANL